MKRIIAVCSLVLTLVAVFVFQANANSLVQLNNGLQQYLPIVMRPVDPTPTPTLPPNPTQPLPTPTFTPTTSPAPTIPPILTTGKIDIVKIFANGSGTSEPDEYVEIKNIDTVRIQMQNWTLTDIQNHQYTFISFIMEPGQTCRVYTNQNHPEYCGFNYGSGSAIWNNSGDCAYLRNSGGALIDQFCN